MNLINLFRKHKTKSIIAFFCIVKLALHLLADYHSGFQGDELLHIQTGNHLAFGYMEFPPFIGLLAFVQNIFQSDSVYIHHIFAHLATIIIMVLVSKITIELGGGSKAVFLVLLCILIAPGFGRSQQLFQPVVFSQLFWVLSFYQLLKYIKYLDRKFLWYLTFSLVLGFLTKYDSLFFIVGLPTLLLFKRSREALVRDHFWKMILIFLILISPNIVWQYLNDFPLVQMFGRLYETQLDKLSPFGVLRKLILSVNPLSMLVLIPALLYLFSRRENKLYWPLSATILLSTVVLAWCQGKQYYFFPIVLTLLPYGGVFLEENILRKARWAIYPLSLVLLLGLSLITFGLPIYSLENYIKYNYRYEKKEIEGGQYGIHYQERYSKSMWKNTMKELKLVYDNLPVEEQKYCLIWGKHYGQAGAITLFGNDYNLPEAFSYHGSFYTWSPKGPMPQTIISLRSSNAEIDFFQPFFEEVIPVRKIYNPYADDEEDVWQTIYLCKGPKQDFDQMKTLFKARIFE